MFILTKIYKHIDLYFTIHQFKFSKTFWEVNIFFFVKMLMNFPYFDLCLCVPQIV